MQGNAVYRFTNSAILSVAGVDAPEVVTSDEFDSRLAGTYERTGMRPGLLQAVAGIKERRWWPEGTTFVDAAVMAGEQALADAGIEPDQIGLLIDTSVCKEYLEPSAAVSIHHRLGLPSSCLNFDLANACLGFVNGMQLAAMMIDAGQIEYALIVDGEGSRTPQQRTLARLSEEGTTAGDVYDNFATLTLGSGGAAMVIGPADRHPDAHRIIGGVARAATQHHTLCVGDLDSMRTDTRALLEAGLAHSEATWKESQTEFDWSDMDCYVIHQISLVHTSTMCERLGIDQAKAPLTFPTRGNIGPASVPFTLAQQADSLQQGDRVLCMGIGSGINAMCLEIAW